jgi:NitT/TauT family transport system permease protein
MRLACAYILALIIAIPLAYLATENKTAEKILLPLFDILESVPVLAFFPLLILFFIHINFPNGAAIFILFLSMLWNIVFTVVGGLKIIPKDITYASHVFHIRGWNYIRSVLLPSIFPEIVTGSILAVAQGWNLIIVAEIIHSYIPLGTESQDLFGIGSIMVNAGTHGNTGLFITCLSLMVTCIALLNYFVWQKLMKYSERFKFE